MSCSRIKQFASAGRDVAALLFTPAVTLIAIWLVFILAYLPWATETQSKRIDYLGALAIISLFLVGLGGQWFQRNRLTGLKATGLGGTLDLTTEPDPDNSQKQTGQGAT